MTLKFLIIISYQIVIVHKKKHLEILFLFLHRKPIQYHLKIKKNNQKITKISFCLPCDDHTLKHLKLMLVFFLYTTLRQDQEIRKSQEIFKNFQNLWKTLEFLK